MVVSNVLTPDSLAHFVKKNKAVVVMFGAPWCGYCKNILPLFEALSEDKKTKKIVFLYADSGTSKDVAREEKISAFPTFKFYRKGKVVEMFAGSDPDKLKKKLWELAEM